MGITERIDAVTHINEYEACQPAPKAVKIELTGRCNFNCSFCARSKRLREVQNMDRDFYSRIIREMRDAGVQELGLFYLGESFLVPWLPDAIKEAKDVGFPYVFLTTNGSLANGPKVAACMKAGLDSLKFSFNYDGPEQLSEIAGVKAAYFDAIVDNIREAKHIRDKFSFGCGLYASYIEYNGAQRERMMKVVDKIAPYLDEVYGLPLYGQAGPQDSPIEAAEMQVTGGNVGRADNPVPALPCWSVFSEGHITFDGKLSACCWDHNDGMTMGDLTTTPFMEAWNSEVFQQLRIRHLQKDVMGTPCQTCIYGK